MQLTEEQKTIIRKVLADLDEGKVVTMGGYAGTGKTTCITTIVEALKNKGMRMSVCAFTGKAANVLRKKGMSASTIHSTIYQPTTDDEGTVSFTLKSDYDMRDVDGFIVDEASMVGEPIHKDLASYEKPILYVGDHGQLEPIGGKFNLMAEPDYRLETVHRNAGEIAHFAEHLRRGLPSTSFQCGEKVQVVRESAVGDNHYSMVDQTICAFNKTRVSVNERVRRHRNIDLTHVVVGEKVICLRNNKTLGLFNGMQGVVTRISKRKDTFDFDSEGMNFRNIMYDTNQWGQEKNLFKFSQDANPFDYAYCITCHKAQGDEFGSVIVMEQICSEWDHRKWSYTAASRAKEALVYVSTPRFIPAYL